MGLRKHQWFLALLIGVLLGLLAVLLVRRSEQIKPVERPVWSGSAPSIPLPTPEQPAAPPPASPEPTPGPVIEPMPTPDPALEETLSAFAQNHPGRWSLCYQALPEGEPIFRATDQKPMVSASLIKLYVMAVVYEQMERGALEHDAVYDKLYAMITVSDNASANDLIRLLGEGDAEAGMAAVNEWCRSHGYPATELNRLMLADNGLQNYTDAMDCARLLAAIYRGECISAGASEEMMALLLAQTVNDRLPAELPAGTPIAHKTGDLASLCYGDVGIIFAPGGDYILCAIANDPPYDREAITAIGELSGQIWHLRGED